MRKLLIGFLLAGAAATPALAQDNGERWHRDQQQAKQGEAHQQRQQAQPQQQARGPRFDGGNPYRQQAPQFVREQQVQVQQGQRGGWPGGRFERAPNAVPRANVPQQAYGYQGAGRPEGNRSGWVRGDAYRQGEVMQQQVRNGWYGQRGAVQSQYREANRYTEGGWNRDWREDRRYDWRRYRDSHRSIFQLGVYIDPFGYGYQPFSIGYRLPQVYFGQRYWIDPGMFDLPYPPPGTQWVRYWNDALLVDVYTGQIVDAIPGFFW